MGLVNVPNRFDQVVTRNLSSSGNQVFFESVDPLVGQDTNGVQDVYEWEADGAGSCQTAAQNGGCIYLISSGKSPDPSFFADASSDGDDVFFFTTQPLVGQDRDQLVDIYDARVDGGLASQDPTTTGPPCAGDECRSESATPPEIGTPTSAASNGEGNLASSHKKRASKHTRCRRRTGRSKNGKCLRKHRSGNASDKRRAK